MQLSKNCNFSLAANTLAFLLLVCAVLPVVTAAADVTQQQLAVKRTDIEQNSKLTDDQRQQGLARLDEARIMLEDTVRISGEIQELQTLIKQAPEKLVRLQQASDAQTTRLTQAEIDHLKVDELETRLSEQERLLQKTQNDLVEKEKQLNTYLAVARTGSGDVAALVKKRDKLAAGTAVLPPENGDALAVVNRLWRDAQLQLLKARIGFLSLRLDNINPLTALIQAGRDELSNRITGLNEQVAQLREAVRQKRQTQAEIARKAAKEALQDAPAPLKNLQQQIGDLTTEQAGLVSRENILDQQIEHVTHLLAELGRDHDRIQYIVEFGGNSAQASVLLQKRRDFAPPAKTLTGQIIEHQKRLSESILRQLELDEQLRETSDRDKQIDALLNDIPAQTARSERERLRGIAQEKWNTYRSSLLELWKTYTRYVGKLSTLEADTRQLLQTTKTYRAFIDDHLLWMPSAELIPLAQPALLLDAFQWFLQPEHLQQLLDDAVTTAREHGAAVLVWLLVFATALFLRQRVLKGLQVASAATKKVRTDSFAVTLLALGYTVVLVLPLPLLFIGAGMLLGLSQAHDYTISIAAGLQGVGHTLLMLDWLRQISRDKGLARSHLLWQNALCVNLGKQTAWLLPLVLPLTFLLATSAVGVPSAFTNIINAPPSELSGQMAIGRLAFIAIMILLSIAIYRTWRRDGTLMQALATTGSGVKWVSYHVLWFVPSIGLPLGLAVAALAGYFYTAVFLASMVGETIWFFIALMLFKDLLLRSLYVTQRRLRFQDALRHREELLAQRAAAAGTIAETESPPIDEEKINYGELSDKVSQLVRMGYSISLLLGLWWIWKDVIPAFGVLNNIELPITSSRLVDGVSQDIPLTLGHMIAGLLFGGLALLAARHVPALLELTLLQRLPMSRASRYALTAMMQYLVAMIGLIITFKTLGLQWSNIQWLVAALSVGLGFGLQEIVANFVSGIILLFEQPIRVGDVVTVEGISGTVTRIRIRATTIVNWERQELIIPNKSFITGQLINWTLSDTVNRVIINVGVAYGSDTRKAMQLIQKIADEHPKVLKDPAPRITFEGFGDSTLNLVLRAYLDEIDARLPTITELHQAINDSFAEAGIVIAFPQRDVHLDTSSPLELVLRREPPQDKPA